MKLTTIITSGLMMLCVVMAGCKQTPDNEDTLKPFTLVYVEGDDGLQTYTLKVADQSNHFMAEEIKTDNYSVPSTFDTSRVLALSKAQIERTRQFLTAAANLPKKCDQTNSVTQQLTILFSHGKITAEGNCRWKDAYYPDLRKYLFGKE